MPFDTCALKKTQSIRTPGITPPLVAVFAGAGPWFIHKLAGDETCRMDQGPVGPGYRLSPGAPLNNCGWASTSHWSLVSVPNFSRDGCNSSLPPRTDTR